MSVEDEIRASLQDWGREIKSWLPDGFGFVLLVAEHGEGGTMLYTSSIRRPDAIQAMREFVAVASEERNWQQEMPELELEEEFAKWWAAQEERIHPGSNVFFRKELKQACRDAFVAGRSTA